MSSVRSLLSDPFLRGTVAGAFTVAVILKLKWLLKKRAQAAAAADGSVSTDKGESPSPHLHPSLRNYTAPSVPVAAIGLRMLCQYPSARMHSVAVASTTQLRLVCKRRCRWCCGQQRAWRSDGVVAHLALTVSHPCARTLLPLAKLWFPCGVKLWLWLLVHGAAAVDVGTVSTTNSGLVAAASGGTAVNVYETPTAVSEYLMFHFMPSTKFMPYAAGPHTALDFTKR